VACAAALSPASQWPSRYRLADFDAPQPSLDTSSTHHSAVLIAVCALLVPECNTKDCSFTCYAASPRVLEQYWCMHSNAPQHTGMMRHHGALSQCA
jgi:hypothetical protein